MTAGETTAGGLAAQGHAAREHAAQDHAAEDFLAWPDLAARALGGSVIHPGEQWAICKDSEGTPFGLACGS